MLLSAWSLLRQCEIFVRELFLENIWCLIMLPLYLMISLHAIIYERAITYSILNAANCYAYLHLCTGALLLRVPSSMHGCSSPFDRSCPILCDCSYYIRECVENIQVLEEFTSTHASQLLQKFNRSTLDVWRDRRVS